MTSASTYTQPAAAALAAALFAVPGAVSPLYAAPAPTLWGYGVKSCTDFLTTVPGAGAPAAVGSDDYLRYREWLAGLVTGINLATASDVLRGAELEAALGRIGDHCRSHPRDDFFNAAMALIRSLRGGKGAGTGKSK